VNNIRFALKSCSLITNDKLLVFVLDEIMDYTEQKMSSIFFFFLK